MLLTKSKFIAGEQCLKRLYLLVHEPELGAQPDDSDDSIIEQGLRHACTSVQMGEPWYSRELKDELGTLKYPVYFMDFETLSPCIPRFPGDQLPFQWSVHVRRQAGTEPEHHEFLAMDTSDPRSAAENTVRKTIDPFDDTEVILCFLCEQNRSTSISPHPARAFVYRSVSATA